MGQYLRAITHGPVPKGHHPGRAPAPMRNRLQEEKHTEKSENFDFIYNIIAYMTTLEPFFFWHLLKTSKHCAAKHANTHNSYVTRGSEKSDYTDSTTAMPVTAVCSPNQENIPAGPISKPEDSEGHACHVSPFPIITVNLNIKQRVFSAFVVTVSWPSFT